jgi:hypothetical protein
MHRTHLHDFDDMGQLQPDPPVPDAHQEKSTSSPAHNGLRRASSAAIRPGIALTGST